MVQQHLVVHVLTGLEAEVWRRQHALVKKAPRYALETLNLGASLALGNEVVSYASQFRASEGFGSFA